MRYRLLVALALLAFAGCAKQAENFTPVERAGALSPDGQRASVYDIIVNGQVVGEATVWSDGASREELPERGTRTVVHLGVLVESYDQPLRLALDEVALARVLLDEVVLDEVRPTVLIGDAVVPQESVKRFDLYFEMPSTVMPQEVDGFDVRWIVTDATGVGRYTQHTPFVDNPWLRYAVRDRAYYTPFHDPSVGSSPYDSPPRVIVEIPPPPTARPRAER